MGCKSECKYSCINNNFLRLNTFHLTIISVTLDCIFVLEMENMLRDEALLSIFFPGLTLIFCGLLKVYLHYE